MIKWIYDKMFLEHHEVLFIVSMIVIVLIILTTIYLVMKELKYDVHK